jgi:hypothetical protein
MCGTYHSCYCILHVTLMSIYRGRGCLVVIVTLLRTSYNKQLRSQTGINKLRAREIENTEHQTTRPVNQAKEACRVGE